MSVQTRDGILLAVALFSMVGCVYFYIAAVVDRDRALSRFAVLVFVAFGVEAIVIAVRILM